jgi:hypothetical protein
MAEFIKPPPGMKGTTRKRWIIVGLVVAALIIALAASTGRPSGPIFSVRVVGFSFEGKKALVEITNNTGREISYSFEPGQMTHTWEAGNLDSHQGRVISIPAKSGDVFAIGRAERRFIRSRSWWARHCVRSLHALGAWLFIRGEVGISITNTTEWTHSRDVCVDKL